MLQQELALELAGGHGPVHCLQGQALLLNHTGSQLQLPHLWILLDSQTLSGLGNQGKKQRWELPGPQATFKERSVAGCGELSDAKP